MYGNKMTTVDMSKSKYLLYTCWEITTSSGCILGGDTLHLVSVQTEEEAKKQNNRKTNPQKNESNLLQKITLRGDSANLTNPNLPPTCKVNARLDYTSCKKSVAGIHSFRQLLTNNNFVLWFNQSLSFCEYNTAVPTNFSS
jgi:hypothetical protein